MLGSLDFVYCPSRDAAADLAHWTERLGATAVFAVERFGTRVGPGEAGGGAGRRFRRAGRAGRSADPLGGDRPVLLYRVDDLAGPIGDLVARGVEVGEPFEFPYGEG